MATLARMHVELIARADKYAKEMGRAETVTERFRTRLNSAVTSMGARVPAAAAAAATAIVALAVKTGQYADELMDLRDMTGLSTDELQRYRAVAIQAGAQTDIIATSVMGLQKRMASGAEGSADLRMGLDQLGISLTDAQGRTRAMGDIVSEALGKLGDMQDITQRNVTAIKIFGRSAAELTPILGLSSQEMQGAIERAEKLGLVMSGEALEAANDFRIEWDFLKASLAAGARDLSMTVIPVLTSLANTLSAIVANTVRAGQAVPMLFESTFGPSIGAQGIIESLPKDLAGLASRREQFANILPRSGQAARGISEIRADLKELGIVASDVGHILAAIDEAMAQMVTTASDVNGTFALTLPTITVTAEGFRNLSVRTMEYQQSLVPMLTSINETNFALQHKNAVIKYAEQVTRDLMTAEEIQAETEQRLNALRNAGLITQETYNRGMAEAAALTREQTLATNELAAAQSRLSGVLGLLGAFGIAFPFLGQVSGILSAVNSFSGGFAHGGTIASGKWGIVGERGPEIVSGPARVAPIAAGGDFASAVLAQLGPMPQAMTPDAVAAHRWWRQLFQAQLSFARHDGVRFD